MKAWQYSSTKNGLEKNLRINASAPLVKPKPTQHLVQVIVAALNPVDYKPAEAPFLGRFIIPKPATPCIDFAGRIVTPAANSSLQKGQLIFGASGTTPFAGGALAEFTTAEKDNVIALPEGLDPVEASTIPVAGLTAYQSIVPYVKKGDRVFINGGSGGCGVLGIQIAKAVGCRVTTSCSTANVELCKRLGADDVVDYKKQPVVEGLKASSQSGQFDHVVDNVGHDFDLYWRCHEYTRPGATYVMVAASPNFHSLFGMIKIKCIPAFLGGGKRRFATLFSKPIPKQMTEIATWMQEGKIHAVIDSRFPFEQAPQAFEKLKTNRAKGKIVVEVTSNGGKQA